MKTEPYERQPGEFEIRILSDGRVVLVAPDETLLELGDAIDANHPFMQRRREARHRDDGRHNK